MDTVPFYNIYYLQGGRQFKRSYPMSGLLYVVQGLLLQGAEITGILAEKDDE